MLRISLDLPPASLKMSAFKSFSWMFFFVAMVMVSMTSCAKILLIPASYYSHVNMFSFAAKVLKDDGHDVTVLVHDSHADRVEKANARALKYPLSENAIFHTFSWKVFKIKDDKEMNIFSKGYNIYKTFTTGVDTFCEELLGNEQVMNEIRDAKYDLAIVDGVPFLACIQYIPYKFGIRKINLGPFERPRMYGVSSVPFHEAPVFLELKTPQMNLAQRIQAVFAHLFEENLTTFLAFSKHAKVFLPEKPLKTISELMNEAELTLVTVETTCFDFPKVSAPHYRFIGSLSGPITPKTLPDDLRKFADDAKDGFIIVSFGSMIDMRKTIVDPIRMLIEALGRMKERAVLQFTLSDLGDLTIPPNILIREWLPQADLLAHPNTKLFIAHGGLNGHLEATHLGVPVLTLPFQPEQAHNGARAEAKGYGKLLKWDETNTDELYKTIRELIDDKSYKQNIMKCSKILKDIPTASDHLSFWVNHVLKHGSKHLRPVSADMPFYQFFGLDVFAVLLLAFIIIILVLYACCKCCVSRCCRSSKLKRD